MMASTSKAATQSAGAAEGAQEQLASRTPNPRLPTELLLEIGAHVQGPSSASTAWKQVCTLCRSPSVAC